MYYWALPSFETTIAGPTLVYSSKYGLVSIGDESGRNNIITLKFDDNSDIDDDVKKWKWIDTKWKWDGKRQVMGATFITDDKLICCGGWPESYNKYVDIYNFKTKKATKLAQMNEKRWYPGICFDEFFNDKVYVGGGSESEKNWNFTILLKINGYH